MKIFLLKGLNTSRDVEDISMICPQNLQIPEGFVLSGGDRKFIVTVDEKEVYLFIGPRLTEYYYHKDIAKSSCGKIIGGGSISFEFEDGKWMAKIYGSSGDYGVFNVIILTDENRSAISDILNMPVVFKWEQ